MYTVKVKRPEDKEPVLELRTEDRKLLKPAITLLQENKLSCEVTEEVKPRPVKIKGLD